MNLKKIKMEKNKNKNIKKSSDKKTSLLSFERYENNNFWKAFLVFFIDIFFLVLLPAVFFWKYNSFLNLFSDCLLKLNSIIPLSYSIYVAVFFFFLFFIVLWFWDGIPTWLKHRFFIKTNSLILERNKIFLISPLLFLVFFIISYYIILYYSSASRFYSVILIILTTYIFLLLSFFFPIFFFKSSYKNNYKNNHNKDILQKIFSFPSSIIFLFSSFLFLLLYDIFITILNSSLKFSSVSELAFYSILVYYSLYFLFLYYKAFNKIMYNSNSFIKFIFFFLFFFIFIFLFFFIISLVYLSNYNSQPFLLLLVFSSLIIFFSIVVLPFLISVVFDYFIKHILTVNKIKDFLLSMVFFYVVVSVSILLTYALAIDFSPIQASSLSFFDKNFINANVGYNNFNSSHTFSSSTNDTFTSSFSSYLNDSYFVIDGTPVYVKNSNVNDSAVILSNDDLAYFLVSSYFLNSPSNFEPKGFFRILFYSLMFFSTIFNLIIIGTLVSLFPKVLRVDYSIKFERVLEKLKQELDLIEVPDDDISPIEIKAYLEIYDSYYKYKKEQFKEELKKYLKKHNIKITFEETKDSKDSFATILILDEFKLILY